MPNHCVFSGVVHGSYAEAKDFHSRLVEANERSRTDRVYGSFSLYRGFGFTDDEINDRSLPYTAGDSDEIHEPCFNGEDWHVYFSMTNRWTSNVVGMNMLLSRFYKTLKGVYYAEEAGNGIFINTDVDRKFFKVSFCIDDPNIGMAFFDDEQEMLDHLMENYRYSFPLVSHLNDDDELVITPTLTLYFHRFRNI